MAEGWFEMGVVSTWFGVGGFEVWQGSGAGDGRRKGREREEMKGVMV